MAKFLECMRGDEILIDLFTKNNDRCRRQRGEKLTFHFVPLPLSHIPVFFVVNLQREAFAGNSFIRDARIPGVLHKRMSVTTSKLHSSAVMFLQYKDRYRFNLRIAQ